MARPTQAEVDERSRELARAEALAQGLPLKIEDPATYAAIGRLLHDPTPLRSCAACGRPCSGRWCSDRCQQAEDGYPHEDDAA